ncbi:MAG: hypothetical protein M3179_04145 [Actinomycetota bacterium]|nr:hypothetical protein [Actinomycetota bacterium]
MAKPDYLICLQCQNPTYQFEFVDGQVVDPVCTSRGADDPSDFRAP